jgi:hypothetical protein
MGRRLKRLKVRKDKPGRVWCCGREGKRMF